MLLSELEWSDLSQCCKRAEPAFGLVVYWRHVAPEYYSIYEYPKTRWENLDAITAQAILFHLTSEGKS